MTDPKVALTPDEKPDCTEGCDCDPGTHKWEIEPHPDTKDFDIFVCDNDQAAIEAARRALENLWDDMTPGDEVTVTIRMNKP